MKRSRSRSGITLRDRDRQSSLTIHVCFLHETQFVRTNNANMEEAGILEKITRSGFCYPALNQVHICYSTHRCLACRRSFPADQSDLAPLKSQYTHRVQQTAVRLVIEDDMPYRMASWHLWRDHRVFVPWATIQNWVEAAGEKKPGRR